MICNPCEGTGFKNVDQFPRDMDTHEKRVAWLLDRNSEIERSGDCSCHVNPPCPRCELIHDIEICDCCGDGEGWYGVPGEHYGPDDPRGPRGPYGGLAKCH